MSRLCLIALLAVLPAVASAQVHPGVGISNWTTQVSSQGTNSTQNTACITLRQAKYLVVAMKVDRDGTPLVSAAATTCKAHLSSDCTDTIPIQLGSCSGNTCTEFNPSWAIDADEGWGHRFDVAGYDYAKCATTFTAGDSGDVISIYTRTTRE